MIRIERPAGEPGPVVYDSPHSGTDYPADFGHALDRMLLRQAEDTHVDRLFDHVPGQGAPLLLALFPRAYVDVNRTPEDIDPTMIEGGWPHPIAQSTKIARGAGLIWRRVKRFGEIYDRALTAAEVEARIARCWQPYHAALASLIDDAHARHGRVYHVNCHSMPEWGDATTEDGPVRRADFVLGDRDGSSCEPGFTAHVRTLLEDEGYAVAVNHPYKGVELVRRYSDPGAGRHSLQLEINRRLYMDETTLAPNARYAATKAVLTRLTAAIAAYAVKNS